MAPAFDKSTFVFSFQTRADFWAQLKSQHKPTLDLLIIGGGIVGAGVLRESVLSGVNSVLLVDKSDFSSGASSASTKLIHAGLRYLETSWEHAKNGRLSLAWENFRFVLASSFERKRLRTLCPRWVKPEEIYFVQFKDHHRPALSLIAGVYFYWFIQLLQGQYFHPPKIFLKSNAIRNNFPELNSDKVKGIYSFWDSQTDDSRLVLINIQDAVSRGARAMNYVKANIVNSKDEGVEVRLEDQESKDTITVYCKSVINATGAWIDELRGNQFQSDLLVDRVAGGHFDISPKLSDKSFYLTAADGRFVFALHKIIGNYSYTRLGTTERELSSNEASDNQSISKKEEEYLLNILKTNFSQNISFDSLIHKDEGIRPLRRQENQSTHLKSREHDIVLENRIAHLVGVKLTDYRRVAAETMNKLPWSSWNIPINSLDDSSKVSLNSPLAESNPQEETIEDLLNQTMILHLSDYRYRRQGIYPVILENKENQYYKEQLKLIKEKLNWSEVKLIEEINQCASSGEIRNQEIS